jgi:CrcB protein
MTILAIALGGAGGSVLRYLLGGAVQRAAHSGFPFGTLAVNVLGCLLIGILVELFMNLEPQPALRGLLVVGFCGGFTTFSAFSSETIGLLVGGEYSKAALYAFFSVTLCLVATAAGISVTRALAR